MLTDVQIKELCGKMHVPLEAVVFKSSLKDMKLKYNRSYVINLENEFNEDGKRNEGSHWCALQVDKYPNGKMQGIWMDPFGISSPNEVNDFASDVMKMGLPEEDIHRFRQETLDLIDRHFPNV